MKANDSVPGDGDSYYIIIDYHDSRSEEAERQVDIVNSVMAARDGE